MRIGKIMQLCKANERVLILNGTDEQWLSDGIAAYPIHDACELNKESVLTLFDINSKKAEKMDVREMELPYYLSFENSDENESDAVQLAITIGYCGTVVIPFKAESGVVFIETKYVSPYADETDIDYYIRYTKNENKPYIVAKRGFCIVALIPTLDIADKELVRLLDYLKNNCKVTVRAGGQHENA